MIYDNILQTVGNTPLIRLNSIAKDIKADVVVKFDAYNPGNSIKDRIAIKIVEDAEKNGLLKPGGTIVEGTSGNTGMGLALVAIVKGYKCIFTTNDKQSKEKIDILKAVGAEVIVCPTNVAPDDPRSYYSVAKKISEETPNSFYVNQYFNLSNRAAHYESTGPELWEQTEGKVTHVVAGVGTGGTLSGTGRYLKEKNPHIKLIGIDSYGSVLKKYHETGEFDENEIYSYITEGIGEDILPDNIDFEIIDHFEKVTDKDGAVYARKLAKEEGIFAGYSAGSAIGGLLQLKDQFKEGDLVVVILHDHGSRYVGKIYNDEWMRERKFLDDAPPTASGIAEAKQIKDFITVQPTDSVKMAFEKMKDLNLSQLPVMNGEGCIGSISESRIIGGLIDNPELMQADVQSIMGPAFPEVNTEATAKEISSQINKDNSAVLVNTPLGLQIITEFDLIEAMAK